MIWIVTLPLPPKELHPNARPNRWAKAAAIKLYRANAGWGAVATFGNQKPRWECAKIQATFYFRTDRKRDPDNLLASLKSAFDGLKDAGIIADDSGLVHKPVRCRGLTVGMPFERVELEIWEA